MKKIIWIPVTGVGLFVVVALVIQKLINDTRALVDKEPVAFLDLDFRSIAGLTMLLIVLAIGTYLKDR